MSISFKRILNSGWKSFLRNKEANIATVFIMIVTITFLSSLILLKDISRFLVDSFQEKADISIYFKEESLEEGILGLKDQIAQLPEVKKIEYVSKEKALESFVQRHKGDPLLIESLEELGTNPFVASLVIKASETSQYDSIVRFLGESDFNELIEKVDYYQRKSVIERIFSLTSLINKGGVFFGLLLALIAVSITFNTIRLSIVNCQEEIKLMKLVGASNWFIRGPFLVQGIISGLLAAVISMLILFTACYVLGPKTEILSPGLNIFKYFLNSFWVLLFVQLFVGMGLGVFSSYIAIRKHLRV